MIEQQAMGPIGNVKYSDYAADIRESGQHLLGIINDILDLSKVEAGKETLHEQDIAFEAVVSGTRLLVEGRASEAGVNLAFDCPAVLPGGRADKRRMIQILVNLLSNRSEEHTSELQSLMRVQYAVICLKKKKYQHITQITHCIS